MKKVIDMAGEKRVLPWVKTFKAASDQDAMDQIKRYPDYNPKYHYLTKTINGEHVPVDNPQK